MLFIHKVPLSSLVGSVVDIASTATPQRYRFVDCSQFTQHQILHIYECQELSDVKYSTISYVWRGNDVDPNSSGSGTFSVKGAEEADPISIDVLRHACEASLKRGLSLIWLDRLCIMQTNRSDKNWQIKQMYKVYQSCAFCVVLAGGVQRLVRLDEETSWIHRGWTLQEALAPPSVFVLFSWKLGPGKGSSGDAEKEDVEEVVASQSAMASLSIILSASTTGYMSFKGNSFGPLRVEVKIFSAQPSNFSYNDIPLWRTQRKILAPNVTALAIITDESMEAEAKDYAIWQSALMRTSSRPVDMVFSIMGIFGVALDAGAFHKDDRIGATIALAQEILKKGGCASWLGASFRLEPCKELSTFPTFPRTSVSGKALIRTKGGFREVSGLMDSEYPYAAALVSMPRGTMDSDGYLSFHGKAIRVSLTKENLHNDDRSKPSVITATDGSIWQVDPPDPPAPPAFAILLGWFNGYYPGATPAHDANNIRALLVQEHAPGKSHVKSYFSLARQTRPWVTSWEERTFCVGGPSLWKDKGSDAERTQNEDAVHEVIVVDELRFPTGNRELVTLKDKTTRDARWAVEQTVLERHYAPQN